MNERRELGRYDRGVLGGFGVSGEQLGCRRECRDARGCVHSSGSCSKA
jgi:hypothetical protein